MVDQESLEMDKPLSLEVAEGKIEDYPVIINKFEIQKVDGVNLPKVVFFCKHEKIEELFPISSCFYIKGNGEIGISGLWLRLNKDGKIIGGDALLTMLEFFQIKRVEDLIGKTVNFGSYCDVQGYKYYALIAYPKVAA